MSLIPEFPEVTEPELVDVPSQDGEPAVRFVSVRSLVGAMEGLEQIVKRVGNTDNPRVQGHLEILEALIEDFEGFNELPTNFV